VYCDNTRNLERKGRYALKNKRQTSNTTARRATEAKASTSSQSSNTLALVQPEDGDFKREVAEAAVQPSVHGAATLLQWKSIDHEIDLGELIAELERQSQFATSGRLERSEAMLIIQAHTLDAIFNKLARKASGAEYVNQFEAYLRLGLKAQGQCRATLETLAALKNPAPVAFVRQANIANGPQQVNNAPPTTDPSRARETQNQPKKLLEQQYEEWLDGGAMQAAVSGNSSVEALGAVHGTKDNRG
jgi:hypothetical protein